MRKERFFRYRGAGQTCNQEGAPDLCPLTRWPLGAGKSDAGIPGAPAFSLSAPGGGNITVFDVGFADTSDTSSVSSGTLQIFSWNELLATTSYFIAAAVDDANTTISLNQVASPNTGDIIQSGTELMTVISVDSAANTYNVLRGAVGSTATAHGSSEPVLHLERAVLILPFAREFFENRASINYLHTASLPDVRVCAAQLYVTNSFGDSQAASNSYTMRPDGGLRTLSGGQFSLQVSGYLATQQNAAPPLLVQAAHAVRDIRASVTQAPQDYTVEVTILQNGVLFGGDAAALSIASGKATSNIVDGVNLPPLEEDAELTVNITLTLPQGFVPTPSSNPGRDLTVTLRL